MGDENPNAMNPSIFNSSIVQEGIENHEPRPGNLENCLRLNDPYHRVREEFRYRTQLGEPSVADDERPMNWNEIIPYDKSEEALVKTNIEEECCDDAGGFFDCRICLDIAKDPVATSCGHLFCWPCIYRWLNFKSVVSDSKACPVCKGEVSMKGLTPITDFLENDDRNPKIFSTLKIPPRPMAQRIESWKETIERLIFSIPMEEIVWRIGRKIDLNVLIYPQHAVNASSQGLPGETNPLLHWIMTSKGMRREQNYIISPNEEVDALSSSLTYAHTGESHIDTTFSPESDFLINLDDTSSEQEPHLPVDVDDSSNITADIHSNQTLKSVLVEVDSGTIRRYDDSSTISNMDADYSPPFRRRRIT